MSGDGSLTFYYPSRVVGGVEMLFLRLARYLSSEMGVSTSVVDYPDGFLARAFGGTDVAVVSADAEPPSALMRPENTIVLPLSHVKKLVRWAGTRAQTRVVLWSLQPENLLPWFALPELLAATNGSAREALLRSVYRTRRSIIRRVVLDAHGSNSLWLMDGENVDSLEQILAVTLPDPTLVPVPVPCAEAVLRARPPVTGSPVRAAWLGRLASEKVPMLERILLDLDAHCRSVDSRATFDVIGDGPLLKRVVATASGLAALDVRFGGTVAPAELANALAGGITVLFAMGTSALEGARVGLPTVLVDASMASVRRDYRYRWLHQTERFTLGRVLGRGEHTSGVCIGEVLDAIDTPEKWDEIGSACHAYATANHDLAAVARSVFSRISAASLSLAELGRLSGFATEARAK